MAGRPALTPYAPLPFAVGGRSCAPVEDPPVGWGAREVVPPVGLLTRLFFTGSLTPRWTPEAWASGAVGCGLDAACPTVHTFGEPAAPKSLNTAT